MTTVRLLGLLAETPIHVGAGESTGYVDLPVARETTTDFPILPGSGLKGALRDLARARGWTEDRIATLFGSPDGAGALLLSEGRLLLLPVRSLHGVYRWVTCPLALERFARDRHRAGLPPLPVPPAPEPGRYLGDGQADPLFLEERAFHHAGPLPPEVRAAARELLSPAHERTAQRLDSSVVLLHDDDFAWFARYGLAIYARNVLDEQKRSQNLWYEEAVPADALFYMLVATRVRDDDALPAFLDLFADQPYLQVGGNETVGHGILAVHPLGGAA